MALPTMATGLVVGQYVVPGGAAKPRAAQGIIEFTADVPYNPVPLATPNAYTIVPMRVIGVLDAEGYVCTPLREGSIEPGGQGVRLPATNASQGSVKSWTWTATPKFTPPEGVRSSSNMVPFTFGVPAGQTTDLATVAKVPASTGIGTEQIVALAAEASRSAIDAAASAASVKDQALANDAGVADFVKAGGQTSAALAAAHPTTVNVLGYGASPSAGPATNTAAIRAAIADAKASKRSVYVPSNAFGAPIRINQRIDVSGVDIGGDGKWSMIEQQLLGAGVFYINGVDGSVQNLHLASISRNLTTVTNPGTDAYTGISNNHSAIRLEPGSHRTVVRNVWVTRFHAGVNLVADTGAMLTQGILIDGLECEDVAFGILGRRWKDARMSNIRGNYSLTPGVDYPPHLIYISGNLTDLASYNVQITNVQGWDGEVGALVKLNGVIGGSMSNVQGRNCRGLLDILTVQDFDIDNVVSLDDNGSATDPGPVKASLMLQECTRVKVRNGLVRFKNIDHAEGLQTHTSTDCVFDDVEVVANFKTADTHETLCIVRIYGERNTFRNIKVGNIGADRGTAFLIRTAEGTQIINPDVSGNIGRGFYSYDSTGTTIDYDPARIRVKTAITNSRTLYVDTATTDRLFTQTPGSPTPEPGMVAFNGGTRGPNDSAGFESLSSGHPVVKGGAWVHDVDSTFFNSSGNSNAAALIETGLANIDIEQDVRFGGAAAGLAIRCLPSTDADYLMVDLTPTGVLIKVREAGASPVTLATGAASSIQSGRNYRLRVSVFGNQIAAYVDGVLVATHTLSAAHQAKFGAATRHGWHAGGAAAARFGRAVFRKAT